MSELTETLLADLQGAGVDVDQWKTEIKVDQRAVDEVLQLFQGLDEKLVRDVLSKHENSVEAAMSDLFNMYESKQTSNNMEETTRLLEKAFSGFDKNVIEECVSRNGGDMELASQELLKLMQVQLEEDEKKIVEQKTNAVQQKQAHEKELRGQIQSQLCNQFDVLTKDEVVGVLQKNNYDLPKSVAELREMSNTRKIRNLTHVFSGASSETVVSALEKTDFDLPQAFSLLSTGSEKPPAASQQAVQQEVLANLLREKAGPGAAGTEEEKQSGQDEPKAQDSEMPADSLRVTLEVASTHFKYGDVLQVSPSVSGGNASAHDWIGLFRVGEADSSAALAWAWANKGAVSLSFPSYGVFEARYLRKVDGKVHVLATTAPPLICGPSLSAVSLAEEAGGDYWRVSWVWDEASEKIGSGAWFGLYRKGAASADYLSFQYVGTNDSLVFKKRQTNGEYEVRFFAYKFQEMTKTAPIVVENSDTCTLERIGEKVLVKTQLATIDPVVHKKVWVAVCFANDTRPNKYRRFDYIRSAHQSFEFKCPVHAGIYEARIYDGNNKLVSTSKQLTVM